MKSKYNIGDKVWVEEGDFNREEDIHKPDLVTIEEIEKVTEKNNILFGRTLNIKKAPFIYKMEEGCSYWKAEDEIFLDAADALVLATRANRVLKMKTDMRKEFERLLKNGIGVSDGIYDVTDIDFLAVYTDSEIGLGIEWIKNHKEFWVADAYETDFPILLSDEPRCLNSKKWNKVNWIGSGFNYGSTNIIRNCPRDILILAEND